MSWLFSGPINALSREVPLPFTRQPLLVVILRLWSSTEEINYSLDPFNIAELYYSLTYARVSLVLLSGQKHPVGLLKHRLVVPTPRLTDWVTLQCGLSIGFWTSSQAIQMLLVWWSRVRNHYDTLRCSEKKHGKIRTADVPHNGGPLILLWVSILVRLPILLVPTASERTRSHPFGSWPKLHIKITWRAY